MRNSDGSCSWCRGVTSLEPQPFTLSLLLVGEFYFDALPCARPEVPAVIVFVSLQFLGLLQRIDRGFKRETIVLVVAVVGNVDRRHGRLRLKPHSGCSI